MDENALPHGHPEPFERPEPGSDGILKRLTVALLFIGALGASTVAGYFLGQGARVMPPWLFASLPSVVVEQLPAGLRPPPATGKALADYEFQLVQQEFKQTDGITVDVRLLYKPTGKLVPEAVIFAHRVDMAPDGMPTMTSKLELQPSPEPGTFRFKTDLTMEGAWQLSLAAKVQGETGTVANRLVLKVR